MPSSFTVDFVCDLGEVAVVQIFKLEYMTPVLSTLLLFLVIFKLHLRVRLKMPSYLKSRVHNGEYSECGPS